MDRIASQLAPYIVGASVLTALGAFVYLGLEFLEFKAELRKYRRYQRTKSLWRQRFIKQRLVKTSAIKQMIAFMQKAGIDVKILGHDYFKLDLSCLHSSYYEPNTNTVVLNTNLSHSSNLENDILVTLAHEFGHALARMTNKYYPRMKVCKVRNVLTEDQHGVIRDEQLAWHYGHMCLKALFPHMRDLFKTFYNNYSLAMDSYLKSFEDKTHER